MKHTLYAICILLTGCAATPEKVVEVKIPVPVITPCPAKIPPKPAQCVPKDDTRPAWLQCRLINYILLEQYALELEAQLKVCAE